MDGAAMPSAGHHHDVQHLWALVEELSAQTQQNRDKFTDFQNELARVQGNSNTADSLHINGHGGSGSDDTDEAETIAQLTNRLIETERRAEQLETAYQEQAHLVTAYENGMLDTAERLRSHMYEQAQATNALHAHYNALLSSAREETLQAQLTHQAWQASVARLSEGVRRAHREKSDQALPYRRRIAALREENRVLRMRAGWEPAERDSSDEEDGEGASG